MGLFDRLRATLADNPTVKAVAGPVRQAEARAEAALSSLADDARTKARAVAETFVEPATVDAALERAQQAASTLQAREEEACSHIAQSLSARTGIDVSADTVKRTGRALLTAVVAVEAAELLGGLTGAEGVDVAGGGEAEAVASTESLGSSTEVPPVIYDGMGNMDGTVTITDGGVAIDS